MKWNMNLILFCIVYLGVTSNAQRNGDLHLTEGNSGQLEVYFNGWGFICDDSWGSVDANTACKILGYGTAVTTSIGRYNASRNYKLNLIDCIGNETSILDCGYRTYLAGYCSTREHIYIECGNVNGDVRLTEGDSGLVEVYYNGWGFICDDGWYTVDSNTLCQILGYSTAISTTIGSFHNSRNYKLNYISCGGGESSILDCDYQEYTPNYCSQNEHINVSCGPANGDLRLTGGSSELLEVYYNGWGFICDDGWNAVDSDTACKILGYDTAITTTTGVYNSTSNYKLIHISCRGTESNILDCSYSLYSSFSSSYCSADEHIYIECGPVNGDLRLLTGNSSGLLQVYYNGWGFICDNGWDTVDANTTCRILGYHTVIMTSIARYNANTNYKLSEIRCRGGENSIFNCGYRTDSSSFHCSTSEHIYIECGPVNGDLRLTAGFSGLLEVYYNGWGFICDNGWDIADANTTCKILGYETAITTLVARYDATTNYKLSYISCSGSETSILDCGYSLSSNCSAYEHIYTECGPVNGNLRLTGRDSGLVEVYYNGWGFICDDGWDTVDSNTMCMILGYDVAISTTTSTYHSSTNYKLRHVNCRGNEVSILDCSYSLYTSSSCSSYEHIYISCGPINGELRLAGGSSGLLEVYYNGWGFICDDGWDIVDANTTCKILGYQTAITTSIGRYNPSTNYRLYYINCDGSESSILDCSHSIYTTPICSTSEHIYIECGPVNGDLRLTGDDSGLLEVYYNGWGFICDGGWDIVDANTTCKILGYEMVLLTSNRRYDTSTNYKLNSISCKGNETNILDCGYSKYVTGHCSPYEHIYIECGPVNGNLRLTEGEKGLLEVYYNGWGFICDDGWSAVNAETTCKILGFETVITTSIGRNNTSINYKLNDISCSGGETNILDCSYQSYTTNHCSAYEHIYIECGPVNGDLRLTGGDNGLLEVYYNGWGFICDDGWNYGDANTVCKLLGHNAVNNTEIGRYHNSTNYKLNFIECSGMENSILECNYNIYSPNYCSQNEHIYVSCLPRYGELRLTGGFSGLLEVFYNGWGFICDNGWGIVDANTACKILGYEKVITTSIGRYNVSTIYKLNSVNCQGDETNILECSNSTLDVVICPANEHIFVECGPVNGDLRLAGGDSGLLEVYYNGWGFICDDGWDNANANRVCQLLGHDSVNYTAINIFHNGTNYKLNYVKCRGTPDEVSILNCDYRIYRQGYCSQNEHIYLSCSPSHGDLRLTEGSSGLLEVYYNGWGFICDDGWNAIDANTTCKILGYESVKGTVIGRYNASTNYKLNHINCMGNESTFLDCGYHEAISKSCSTDNHIFIECSNGLSSNHSSTPSHPVIIKTSFPSNTTVLPKFQRDVPLSTIISTSIAIISFLLVLFILLVITRVIFTKIKKKRGNKFRTLNDVDQSFSPNSSNPLSCNPLEASVPQTEANPSRYDNIQLENITKEEPCYYTIDEAISLSENKYDKKPDRLEYEKMYYSNLGKFKAGDHEPSETSNQSKENSSDKQHRGYSKIDSSANESLD